MAGPAVVLDLQFVAGAAITQFQAVTLETDGTVIPANAQGERVIGICQEAISAADVTNGRVCAVRVIGVSRAVANGAVTTGALLTAGADGSVETAATADVVLGSAIRGGADNDHIDVLLIPSNGNVV